MLPPSPALRKLQPLEVRTRARVDVSRDQHEIQVISVHSAGVAFKAQQNWWRIRVNFVELARYSKRHRDSELL